jgi:hypothetical protein
LLGHLTLKVGGHGTLPISLLFQLADGVLLGMDLCFQLRNFVALDLDKRLQASRVRITRVA